MVLHQNPEFVRFNLGVSLNYTTRLNEQYKRLTPQMLGPVEDGSKGATMKGLKFSNKRRIVSHKIIETPSTV